MQIAKEPESIDEEFLRLSLREKGIFDNNMPLLDNDIRIRVAQRCIDLLQRVTDTKFEAEISDVLVSLRIKGRIAEYCG